MSPCDGLPLNVSPGSIPATDGLLRLRGVLKTWMPGTRPGAILVGAADRMAKLKVMCARSMHIAVSELARGFTAASGHELDLDFGTVGGLQTKLDAGETADVLILSVPMIAKMEQTGALV